MDEAGSTTRPLPVPPLLIYSARLTRDTVQVVVAGEVDLATAEQLRGALMTAVGRGGVREAILIDLTDVTFLDAKGIGVLVEARLAADRSGLSFAVCNPQGTVRRVLEITGATAGLGIPPQSRAMSRQRRAVTGYPGRSAAPNGWGPARSETGWATFQPGQPS
jgi:anti-sigma B factor antagonist